MYFACRKRSVVTTPLPPISTSLRQFQLEEKKEIEKRKKVKLKEEKNRKSGLFYHVTCHVTVT